jgi:uridine kinase
MEFDLSIINRRIDTMPQEYVLESEEYFNSRMRRAADEIYYNLDESPIVLLSGPSASGKTTTSKKLTCELKRLGIDAVTISLDNYFVTVDPETAPRTPAGEIDYESPRCLDMTLLNEHFHKLAAGEEIQIPHFSFSRQIRDPKRAMPMRLGKNQIAVFEGIHALNECIAHEHPCAYKLYVSTMTDIMDHGSVLIDRAGLRLVRRIVRDDYFRGADPQFTLQMWDNIRRGELANILPYKDTASMAIDSAMPYEISVMKQFAGDIFERIPKNTEHYEVLHQVLDAFRLFMTVDPALVPTDSILREFIGGSIFEY